MSQQESHSTPDLRALHQEAFGMLVEPFRRELQAHCYRMLGSVQDAEDVVQETFLRAWRRRETYEGRSTVRAWLYGIATHICLDALKKRPKRFVPRTRGSASGLAQPIPASINEPVWLEPYPDEWLRTVAPHPEGYVTTRENIRLAFVAALHLLPARQRAVLIMRDVLELPASEVANLLEMTVGAVKSLLFRARRAMAESGYRQHMDVEGEVLEGAALQLLNQYVLAWENADVNGLVMLLRDDATFSMPPIPSWYQGRETIRRLAMRTIFAGEARGRWRLLPTRANHQFAFGLYKQSHDPAAYDAYGVQVLTLASSAITDIITFRVPALAVCFGLPASISALRKTT